MQAFSEVPNLNIWYGPDSYMGANIEELFQQMTAMTDEEIGEVHPQHNRNTIKSLLPRLHYFQVIYVRDPKVLFKHLVDWIYARMILHLQPIYKRKNPKAGSAFPCHTHAHIHL